MEQKGQSLDELLKDYPVALEHLKKRIEEAKGREIIIGIDPESFLAKEIFWQSKKLIDLEHSVAELTRSINLLHRKLETILQTEA